MWGERGEGRPVKSHSLGVILKPCPLAFSTQIHDCQVSLYSSKSLAVNDQISQSHCYTRKSHCKSQIHMTLAQMNDIQSLGFKFNWRLKMPVKALKRKGSMANYMHLI